jgi:hypothetical protein
VKSPSALVVPALIEVDGLDMMTFQQEVIENGSDFFSPLCFFFLVKISFVSTSEFLDVLSFSPSTADDAKPGNT